MIENVKPESSSLDRHSLVDVSGKPVLNSHVPGTHAFTHGRRKLTAIQVQVVNCLKVVLYFRLSVSSITVSTTAKDVLLIALD